MGKILTAGILFFVSLGMIITGALLIDNMIGLDKQRYFLVEEIGFSEKLPNGEYSEFKIDILNTFTNGLKVTEIRTNLIGWNPTNQLGVEVGTNKHLVITLKWSGEHTKITDETDLTDFYVHFYLSDSAIIKWQNNNFVIE